MLIMTYACFHCRVFWAGLWYAAVLKNLDDRQVFHQMRIILVFRVWIIIGFVLTWFQRLFYIHYFYGVALTI